MHPDTTTPTTKKMGRPATPLIDRLMRMVKKSDDPDGCWIWTGHVTIGGYGRIMVTDGKGPRGKHHEMAHRVAWTLLVGPIPDGMQVLHDCPGGDNPACVRPSRCFLGTHEDNMADKAKKGMVKGAKNPFHVLSDDDVREIRRLGEAPRWGMTQVEIAAKFGISRVMVQNIIHRRAWSHID